MLIKGEIILGGPDLIRWGFWKGQTFLEVRFLCLSWKNQSATFWRGLQEGYVASRVEASVLQFQGSEFCQQPVSLEEDLEPS